MFPHVTFLECISCVRDGDGGGRGWGWGADVTRFGGRRASQVVQLQGAFGHRRIWLDHLDSGGWVGGGRGQASGAGICLAEVLVWVDNVTSVILILFFDCIFGVGQGHIFAFFPSAGAPKNKRIKMDGKG